MKEYLKGVFIALVAACALAGVATFFYPPTQPSNPTPPVAVRIMHDVGGSVGEFIKNISAMRAAGTLVVVDGQCISSCTMVTSLAPENICATSNAQFVFHSAFIRDEDGDKHYAKDATDVIWHQYPSNLRGVLVTHGWGGEEHNDLLFIEGDEVFKFVRRCTDVDTDAVKNIKPRINVG